ncbi:MAG TPA: hypothetical protein VM124_02655 [Candidatus Limnocylindrales bacterium]|nr:hypothetical protein [Candidatus Limnocylindrales bacterium]
MDTEQLACADKITYDTKSQAVGAAAAVDWQHGTKLKAYKCRHCHLWHLSSASG